MSDTPQIKWDKWATENPDLLASVGRDSDIEQLNIGAEHIINLLSLTKGDRFLDVGCGSGIFLAELVKRTGIKAIGVDFSEKQIDYARKHFSDLGIEFKVCDAEAMDFPDNSFNKILCYGVLHYIKDIKKQKAAIDSFLRICSDGGIICVGDVPSVKHKYRMYFAHIKSLPTSLSGFLNKFGNVIKYNKLNSCWCWVDLDVLCNHVKSLGFKAEILTPPNHKQFGTVTNKYRLDFIITKIRITNKGT